MNKAFIEKIKNANCLDELMAISCECRNLYGFISKKYNEVIDLCLSRFEEIYGITFHEYVERGMQGGNQRRYTQQSKNFTKVV